MVPNWYCRSNGEGKYTISTINVSIRFNSLRNLTPNLTKLYEYINGNISKTLDKLKDIPESIAIELFQEQIALFWLNLHNNKIDWEKVFEYDRSISNKTQENQNISKNIVFSEDNTGDSDLLYSNNKISNSLASDEFTYYEVDKDLKYIDYKVIDKNNRHRNDSYQFMPEFLMHFKNIKQDEIKWSFHKTKKSDLIIFDQYAFRVTKRKGIYTLYDVETLKNAITSIVGDYSIGCNIFELIFDLSYKRKGALLILDKDTRISDYIVNPNSLISNTITGQNSIINDNLNSSVKSINFKGRISDLKKEILIELCSLDGAVIFDENLLGYGSMIKTSSNVTEAEGARLVAAKSSQEYGFPSILISSDGVIKIFFKNEEQGNEELIFY